MTISAFPPFTGDWKVCKRDSASDGTFSSLFIVCAKRARIGNEGPPSETSEEERKLVIEMFNFVNRLAPPAAVPMRQAYGDGRLPSRLVHVPDANGNILIRAVSRDGSRHPWLRVAESRALATRGMFENGLYADRFFARGQPVAVYVGRAIGPQPSPESWEKFEAMQFNGDAFQQDCHDALDMMSEDTHDILYTWVRNTLLECTGRADMLITVNGVQIDGGSPPGVDNANTPYPCYFAHMANDPYRTGFQANTVVIGSTIYATRHLFPGEEILWDYGAPYHKEMESNAQTTIKTATDRRACKIRKAEGLLRFFKAFNHRSQHGSWPQWWVPRSPPVGGRTQPDRKAKAASETKYKVFHLHETDLHMLRTIGIDYDLL
eukprot:jgi/Mesvir1/5648/Mv15666-RA.1